MTASSSSQWWPVIECAYIMLDYLLLSLLLAAAKTGHSNDECIWQCSQDWKDKACKEHEILRLHMCSG